MPIQTNIDAVIKDLKEINTIRNGVVWTAHTGQVNNNGAIKEVFSDYTIVDSIRIKTDYISYEGYSTVDYPDRANIILSNSSRQVTIYSPSYTKQQATIRMRVEFYDKFGNKLSSRNIPKGMSISYTGSFYGNDYDSSTRGISYFSVFGYDSNDTFQNLIPDQSYSYPISVSVIPTDISRFDNTYGTNTKIFFATLSPYSASCLYRLTINDFVIKKDGVVVKRIVPIYELTQQ